MRCARVVSLLLLLVLAGLLPGCGRVLEGDPPPPLPAPVALPLERGTKELVIQVRVPGDGPAAVDLPMVVDSGLSGPVLLSAQTAAALGLRARGIAVATGWGGMRLVRFTALDRMEMGPVRLTRVPAAVMDLPDGVTRRAGRADIAGLLGATLFRAYGVTVDVPAGTLTLSAPGTMPVPPGAVVLPLAPGPLPAVTVAIDGMPVVLAVDTGATADVVLSQAAARRLDLAGRYGPGRSGAALSAAGTVTVTKRTVDTLSFGSPAHTSPAGTSPVTLHHVEVDVVGAGGGTLAALLPGAGALPDGVDGVLGLGLLSQFRFTLEPGEGEAGRLVLLPLAGHDPTVWRRLLDQAPSPGG
ncbi:MAG: Aspartyl protease [Pseudomonadota bacterium]|jgi:hypothetical protein